MAQLDKKAIEQLIKLSRIDLTEAEQEALVKDLGNILAYMDELHEINTDNVPPCNQVLSDIVNVMRDDTVGPTMPREVFLANAPSQIGGMIRVPPVLKNNT